MFLLVCLFFLNIALIELGSHRQESLQSHRSGAVFGAAPAPFGAGGGVVVGNSGGQSEATTKEKPLKQLKTKPPTNTNSVWLRIVSVWHEAAPSGGLEGEV